MEILTSNFPPLKYDYKTFSDSFSKLIVDSDYLQIASGYISTESITEIKRVMQFTSPFQAFMTGLGKNAASSKRAKKIAR